MNISKKYSCIFIIIYLSQMVLFAQEIKHFELKWEKPITRDSITTLSFKEALFDENSLPVLTQNIAIKHINYKANIINKVISPLEPEEEEILKAKGIKPQWTFKNNVYQANHQPYLNIHISGVFFDTNSQTYQKLKSFDIEIIEQSKRRLFKEYSTANNSKMREGDWLKLGIIKTGVHKLSYQELINNGIRNPKDIRIYGYGGSILPEKNNITMPDDMQELPVLIEKGNDGVFGQGDYILFYAEGPDTWEYKQNEHIFKHKKHYYSDTIYYFVSSETGTTKHIGYKPEITEFSNDINIYRHHKLHESNQVNIIRSGREWYGEEHRSLNPSYSFNFNFPNIVTDSLVNVQVKAAARCSKNEYAYSNLNIFVNNQKMAPVKIPSVNISRNEGTYFLSAYKLNRLNVNTGNINIKTEYDKADSYNAWLDYIRISAVCYLKLPSQQITFTNIYHTGEKNRLKVSQANTSHQIWNVTHLYNTQIMHSQLQNNILYFTEYDTVAQSYCIFKHSEAFPVASLEPIRNQNLHGLEDIEYVIVCPTLLKQEAEKLADFHKQHSKLNTIVVTNQEVYNEFSSGTPDITAIKNFMRHLYHQKSINDTLKYLLLFGDGSYDNKPNVKGNTNQVLTYQTMASQSNSKSYTSDDYFGLLDPSEGGYKGLLDIGVGRITVNTPQEAQNAVQKIINYHSEKAYGSWRSVITFAADNGDRSGHMRDADFIASNIESNYPNFNISKIYMDSYPLEVSAGSNIVPEATKALKEQIAKGTLILNYVGHSAPSVVSEEQFLTTNDILSMKNKDRLFVFITASCELTRYDDKDYTSLGEHSFLNPEGGAIALYTTTRIVYSLPNKIMNKAIYNHLYDDNLFRLGDIIKRAKNSLSSEDANMRKFTLIGDPALSLAIPKYKSRDLKINNILVNNFDTINISALSKVTVEGKITDKNHQILSDFNGHIFPTVYDKPDSVSILCQTNEAPMLYMTRKSIIYKGKVSVQNGRFKYSFMVPKDINYKNGLGRISYYATNYKTDAFGHNPNISVSGSSDSLIIDKKGPNIDLFMNNEDFIYGGTTDESPTLIVNLFDENGINTLGNGIGHDVMATIDGNTQKSVNLNSFYEADLDSYQSGKIQYPYENLSEGKHLLKLKAWDVFNNSNQEQLEFIVAESTELAIKNILNYPNPFTTHTQFYFDHNQAGKILDVSIQIFTVSGKLVKTIEKTFISNGFRSEPISWNGKDDFEDPIGRGVYIYKIKVRTEDGETATEYQKLVLLK